MSSCRSLVLVSLVLGIRLNACFAEAPPDEAFRIALRQVALTNVSAPEAIAYVNASLALTGANNLKVVMDLTMPDIRGTNGLHADTQVPTIVHGYVSAVMAHLQKRDIPFQTYTISVSADTIACCDLLRVIARMTHLRLAFLGTAAVLSVFPRSVLFHRYALSSDVATFFRTYSGRDLFVTFGGSTDITTDYEEVHDNKLYVIATEDIHQVFRERLSAMTSNQSFSLDLKDPFSSVSP